MKKFNFKGEEYLVKEMTIGSLINFQKSRAILSDGMYGAMYRMSLPEVDEALIAIDINSFFPSFSPEFVKQMKVGIGELGLSDFNELKKIYVSELKPWLEENMELLKTEKGEK